MPKLKVQKMSCGHCAATVQKAMKSVDPAARVAVDLPSGAASIASEAVQVLAAEAIRSAGYHSEKIAA